MNSKHPLSLLNCLLMTTYFKLLCCLGSGWRQKIGAGWRQKIEEQVAENFNGSGWRQKIGAGCEKTDTL